jgi:hypothetical protein
MPAARACACRQHHRHAPGRGWLLVWTGTAGSSAAQPFPSATTPDTPKPEKATWVVDTSQDALASSTSSMSSAASTAGVGSAASKPPPAAATAAAAGVRGSGSSSSSSSSSGATLMFPGGPSCTLMAWPSRGGGSWSGAVFTAPQVGCRDDFAAVV